MTCLQLLDTHNLINFLLNRLYFKIRLKLLVHVKEMIQYYPTTLYMWYVFGVDIHPPFYAIFGVRYNDPVGVC